MTKKSKIRTVHYIRMSTAQQADSPDRQRSTVQPWAKDQGYTLVDEYLDEGISGKESDKRSDFVRMIEDAQHDKFDVIAVDSQSRFGRFDPTEANYFWHILRKAGVQIHSVHEGLIRLNDLGDWLKASINQYGDHEHSKKLSYLCMTGTHKRLQEGKPKLPATPYGCDRHFPASCTTWREVRPPKRMDSHFCLVQEHARS